MNEKRQSHHGGEEKKGRGPSSAFMHDPKMLLELLQLKKGQVFTDLGFGAGDYTLEAANIVGKDGKVYALDLSENMVEYLSKIIESEGIGNIRVFTADITAPLPIRSGCADVVFIATVLHILNIKQVGPSLFSEIYRILKPGGCLAVVECKKEEQSFGPPLHLRNAPDEIEAVVHPSGFKTINYKEFEYSYMIQFYRS